MNKIEIPKIIHYCWFGRNKKTELMDKCIESWKKYAPEYQIIEWNEDNFDIYVNTYVKEAYESKKWAFVSDYARFHILYEHGGVYLDTDVELIKPIEELINKGAYLGMEPPNKEKIVYVNPGLGMAINKKNPIIKELLTMYDSAKFINENGSFNLTTIVSRTTNVLIKHGYINNLNTTQIIDDINIYPCDYLCPYDSELGVTNITENTYSIHHYDGTWLDEQEKKEARIRKVLIKYLPTKITYIIAHLIAKII